jgi:hypothetical protein
MVFALTGLISLVVLYTADQPTDVDCLLFLGGPPALGILTYFMNRFQDPAVPALISISVQPVVKTTLTRNMLIS